MKIKVKTIFVQGTQIDMGRLRSTLLKRHGFDAKPSEGKLPVWFSVKVDSVPLYDKRGALLGHYDIEVKSQADKTSLSRIFLMWQPDQSKPMRLVPIGRTSQARYHS